MEELKKSVLPIDNCLLGDYNSYCSDPNGLD